MNYIQIIKTTDAELKGYRKLRFETKTKILPLFELTRSRSSKKVPEGDIQRRISDIKEAAEGLPFILDLTSHEDLANYQINSLLDDSEGFSNWVNFIKGLEIENIIPALHIYAEEDMSNVETQAEQLSVLCGKVALRFNYQDPDRKHYLDTIARAIPECEIICVLDGDYLQQENYHATFTYLDSSLPDLNREYPNFTFCFAASSFPSSVTNLPTGGDDRGEVPILEWKLYKDLIAKGHNIIYGDYGSIHPKRYQSRGGSWVPRVDYPLSDTIFYRRYRRHQGGYIKSAKKVFEEDGFDGLPCWGTEQILKAKDGLPEGKSPAFWISVRMNIHSERKTRDLSI